MQSVRIRISQKIYLIYFLITILLIPPFVTSMMSKTPNSIKLYYWDFAFWRAECVRLALFCGDVPFEDVRDAKKDDMKAAGKLAFGALPVMEVDGKILSQTQVMAVYSAKIAGIHPSDPWFAAKVDEVINGCTDVTSTIGSTFSMEATEKIKVRETLAAEGGRLRMHMGGLEKLCIENGNNGYTVSETTTVSDFALWRLAGWFSSGNLDGIQKDYISSNFPAITKVVNTVEAMPKVQEWKIKHPKTYSSN